MRRFCLAYGRLARKKAGDEGAKKFLGWSAIGWEVDKATARAFRRSNSCGRDSPVPQRMGIHGREKPTCLARRPPLPVKSIKNKSTSMAMIDPDRIADQVYAAAKATFSELIRANANQCFYTFGLWTDDSLQFLHAAANTEEGLTATVKRYQETVDPKYGCTSTRASMRWSYGDWVFFPAETAVDHFEKINEVLRTNFDSDWEEFQAGTEVLWPAIFNGFHRLEKERFFGSGAERSKITLLLVGDLPSGLVEFWAAALNPPEVADRFINWNPETTENAGPATSLTGI